MDDLSPRRAEGGRPGGRLQPEQRAVLVLRDVEGLEEAEAACLLDVPLGTVKSRLHRARAAFRKEWTA